MKRYWLNAAQMSVAVTLGFLLGPVVLSLEHAMRHLLLAP
jgi:hypothetical protein